MTHEECRLVMPWLANGTLTGAEREAAEGHVGECEACRVELSELQTIGRAERVMGEEMPAVPVRVGRMMARIDEAETPWWGRIVVMRWAVAGQLAMILLLAGFLLRRDAGFVTQSGGEGDELRIAVMFEPGATEPAIRESVLEVGARVVDGPSAAGLYTLSFPEVKAGELGKAEGLLKRLRGRAGVVRFAERRAP